MRFNHAKVRQAGQVQQASLSLKLINDGRHADLAITLAGEPELDRQRLADGPTRSFGFTKWLVNQSLDTDRKSMMENEALAVELNTYTADSEEGVASFRERRSPDWKGY